MLVLTKRMLGDAAVSVPFSSAVMYTSDIPELTIKANVVLSADTTPKMLTKVVMASLPYMFITGLVPSSVSCAVAAADNSQVIEYPSAKMLLTLGFIGINKLTSIAFS